MSMPPVNVFRRMARGGVEVLVAVAAVVPLIAAAVIARCTSRRGVGLGPEPLINNVHHARALRQQGYEARTYVSHEYYITQQFDVRRLSGRPFNHYALFLEAIFSFEALYIYFNGGPLSWTGLRFLEPWLYRLAGVKVVVMPYGGDVQDFNVHDDVVYRAAYLADYPDFVRRQMKSRKSNVCRWIRHADWVIAGCDWVYYLPHWNTLMLAHFSIDTEEWRPATGLAMPRGFDVEKPLRVLHAPNHRAIKGTTLVERVVADLRAEGRPIELVIAQKLPNDELRRLIQEVDVVVDQLVIGWYGMFALEAMASGKPVVMYIAPELERLYVMQGLLEPGELPVIKVDHTCLAQVLCDLASGSSDLAELGKQGRQFVLRHHSLASVGRTFAAINSALGLRGPSVPRDGVLR